MKQLYFKWMVDKVCDRVQKRLYSKLLKHLNEITFVVKHPLDENREDDGYELRYRFGYETGANQHDIANYIDDHPCTVLEMMVAMVLRMDDMIYDDGSCKLYFWDMIEAIGLGYMTDEMYNAQSVNKIVDRFMYRQTNKGIFDIDDRGRDLRDVEFWCQAMWYLSEDEVV